MHRSKPTIGLIFDAGYARVAEKYRDLIGQTDYSACPCVMAPFDPRHPQQFIESLSRQDVALVHVGKPGPAFAQQLGAFLDAYATPRKQPVLGVISHDGEGTRHAIETWLADASSPRLPRRAGDLITIVDSRSELKANTLQLALDMLCGKHEALLSTSAGRAIPSPRVEVEHLSIPPRKHPVEVD